VKRAIIFHAYQKSYYLQAAKHSAQTAKRVMPDVDIVFITGFRNIKKHPFDRIIETPEPDPVAVTLPPLWLLPEEYSSGIYADAESHFCKPVYDVFELVEDARVDIALVHTSYKKYVDRKWSYPGIPEEFPYWKSSIIAFQHHNRMRDFFVRWKDEFYAGYKRDGLVDDYLHPDQPSLRRALYHSDLAFATLPPHFCCTLGNVVVRDVVRVVAFPKTSTSPRKLAKEANRHAPHARLFRDGKSELMDH
jgi:hypothetical protein